LAWMNIPRRNHFQFLRIHLPPAQPSMLHDIFPTQPWPWTISLDKPSRK